MDRENIHSYFMRIAYTVASRSTCIKRKVGSVIVKDKKIISTGYNNPSVGLPNCTKETCILDKAGKCALSALGGIPGQDFCGAGGGGFWKPPREV